MKTAVGAPAPRPTIEEILQGIGEMQVGELVRLRDRLDLEFKGIKACRCCEKNDGCGDCAACSVEGQLVPHFHGEPGSTTHGVPHSHDGMVAHNHPLENGW